MGGEIILSWQAAGIILSIAIPVMAFLGVQIKNLFFNKKDTQINNNTAKIETLEGSMEKVAPVPAKVTNLEEDFKATREDIAKIKHDLTQLQIHLADGATSEKLNSVNLQISDLKEVMSRFQTRLEKMSDITIKILNSKNGDM